MRIEFKTTSRLLRSLTRSLGNWRRTRGTRRLRTGRARLLFSSWRKRWTGWLQKTISSKERKKKITLKMEKTSQNLKNNTRILFLDPRSKILKLWMALIKIGPWWCRVLSRCCRSNLEKWQRFLKNLMRNTAGKKSN